MAYVIYTSGSTGRPKGVMVSHGSLTNHAQELARIQQIGHEDRHFQFVSLSFDASIEEMFPTLISGATLVLHPEPTALSSDQLLSYCEEHGVTILHVPPAFWHLIVDDMASGVGRAPSSLRVFLTGGESPAAEKLRRWADLTENRVKFLNAYGPTEATITSTVFETVRGTDDTTAGARLPIGRPIGGAEVYVLDDKMRPVPFGVVGELHVGGRGVARGYLKDPALTAEKFVPHPFHERRGERLYRTGDLARLLEDGNIEFLGRADGQVKLRGFRVELGEIEASLLSHPAVREVAVLVREGGGGAKRLVAYVAYNQEAAPSTSEMRGYLGERLPAYMIPAAFVTLDSLPVTAQGKLDRRALPPLDETRPELTEAYVAPGSEMERLLASMWQEELNLDKVGVHDNFFDLGGHSLLIIKIQSRLRDALQREVAVVDLFQYPTVKSLAAHLSAGAEATAAAPPPETETSDKIRQGENRLKQLSNRMRKARHAAEELQ